jgi:hypothetical protein
VPVKFGHRAVASTLHAKLSYITSYLDIASPATLASGTSFGLSKCRLWLCVELSVVYKQEIESWYPWEGRAQSHYFRDHG